MLLAGFSFWGMIYSYFRYPKNLYRRALSSENLFSIPKKGILSLKHKSEKNLNNIYTINAVCRKCNTKRVGKK